MAGYNFSFLAFAALIVAAKGEVYDILIAGAGTAGLVVANRLSAQSSLRVAVIETGDDVRAHSDVQDINFNFATFNTSINYQYPAVTSPALGSRNLTYRAGKAWGGTSAVNGMVYIRGDSAQYDAWELLGNKGWNWNSIFPYYKKGEHFVPPISAQTVKGATYEAAAHGFHGPLDVGYPFIISNGSFYDKARQTWQSLGFEARTELNGGNTHGFIGAPQTLDPDAGVREDSSRAYYTPVENRTNLVILKGTVKRIIWKDLPGDGAVAKGFEYVDPSGSLIEIEARKEVIVSAGAYRSPLILEGSGIGNSEILKKLGIPIKVDLPGVGESMQDHNVVGNTYSLVGTYDGRTPFATLPTAQDVFGNQTASIAASTSSQVASWAQDVSTLTGGAVSPEAVEKRFRIQHDLIFKKNVTIAELFPGPTQQGTFAQYWTSMPFSWGRVHLKAADKIDQPEITPNLFSTNFDRQMLTGVGRLSYKAYSTAPLSDLIGNNTSPGYDVLPLNATDAQWATWLNGNVLNALHVIGSCSMLPKELGGVVDSEARVHGTRNVRVVDSSIIPMPLTGHTMAPIYGVAEKASELILASLYNGTGLGTYK